MAMAKILLVDDDPEDRSIIIDALAHLNAENSISCADNGEGALKLLLEYAALDIYPCLIVLDLNMPRMNGTETLKEVKKDARFRNIAVVIYSTSINPLEKEACMSLGARLYVTKPDSYKESIDTARLFLDLCSS
jgi:CheY-like chemotaxis protein